MLSAAARISPAQLAEHDFIVRERGSGTRAAMEQCFLHEGITPPRVMGLSSHETLKQAVMAGMGLAFLSLDTLGLELKERLLTTLDVIGLPLQRRWCVVRSASEPLTAAAGSLLHYVVDHGGDSTSVTHDAVPALVPLPAS